MGVYGANGPFWERVPTEIVPIGPSGSLVADISGFFIYPKKLMSSVADVKCLTVFVTQRLSHWSVRHYLTLILLDIK